MKSLYLVECKGMKSNLNGIFNGIAYAVAENPAEAYEMVYKFLKEKDLGFPSDRCLDKVTLIAQDGEYPDCGMRLFL